MFLDEVKCCFALVSRKWTYRILLRVDNGLGRGDYEGQLARSQNVADADSVLATKVRLGHKLHS